jgi:hypothetical protein
VEFDSEEGKLVMISDGSDAPPPAWQGDDCWWLRDDAFVSGSDELAQFDDVAYMADGVSVISLQPRVPMKFFAGPVGANVVLTGAVSTAELDGDLSDPSSLKLVNATVAGRWANNELTESGRHVSVCPGSNEQNTLTGVLDQRADVRSNPGDTPSLNQRCNAISMGVTFAEGIQGKLANGDDPADNRVDAPPLPDWCDDD